MNVTTLYAYAAPITPSNTQGFGPIGSKVLLNNLIDAIWVGIPGTVQVVLQDESVVPVFVATVPTIIPLRAKRVNATGTTADKMLALVL